MVPRTHKRGCSGFRRGPCDLGKRRDPSGSSGFLFWTGFGISFDSRLLTWRAGGRWRYVLYARVFRVPLFFGWVDSDALSGRFSQDPRHRCLAPCPEGDSRSQVRGGSFTSCSSRRHSGPFLARAEGL